MGSRNGGIAKLLMKKLGRFDSPPPSVEGSGGVSADGDTGFALALPFAWLALVLVFLSEEDGVGVFMLSWTWVSVVRGCERWARTSGAGTTVGASPAVLVPVLLVPVPLGWPSGVSPLVPVLAAAGLVPLVGAPTLVEGWADDGAGTFVAPVVDGAEASAAGLTVTGAAWVTAGTSTASDASSAVSIVGRGRGIIFLSCRAGS
jgi:hypothetical protein